MKKYFVLLTVMALSVSLPLSALAFSDVSQSNPYSMEITWLSNNGVIRGYPDGTFKPNATVNRAEMLKIVFLAHGLSAQVEAARSEMMEQGTGFPDVSSDQWYAPYVYLAKKRGSVQGYPDGTFKPGNPVKRGEAFKMALNEFYENQVSYTGEARATDTSSTEWFWKYANFASQKVLFDGSVFGGGEDMTRGSVAQLVYRTKTVIDNVASSYTTAIVPLPLPIELPGQTGGTAGTGGGTGTTYSQEEMLQKIEAALPGYIAGNISQAGSYAVFAAFGQEDGLNTWYRLSLETAGARADKIYETKSFMGFSQAALSSDGKDLLITASDGKIFVVNVSTLAKTELGMFQREDGNARYNFPGYTPDGKYILLFDQSGGGFEPTDGILVVSASTRNIAAGSFISGIWLNESGGGMFESGFNFPNYTFLDADSARFQGKTFNFVTLTKE